MLCYPEQFIFPRLTLCEVTFGPEAQRVTQPSLALVRKYFNVKGLRFDLDFRVKDFGPRKQSDNFEYESSSDTESDHSQPNLPALEANTRTRLAVIRRMPFLIAAFDEVTNLKFILGEGNDNNPSHLSIIFRNVANVFQAGFCSRIEAIE
eukprot:10004099-Ditylum_brightwellii.AAC.1